MTKSCPLCGHAEHKDADEMVTRCPIVKLTRTGTPVYLRELFLTEGD